MHNGIWNCPACLAENCDDPIVSKYTCEMCGIAFDWLEIDWKQSDAVCTCDILSLMGGVMMRYKKDCPVSDHAAKSTGQPA